MRDLEVGPLRWPAFPVGALPANLPPGYRRSIEAWHAAVSLEE